MFHAEPPVSVSRRGSVGGDAERTVVWVRGELDIATKASVVIGIARAARRDDLPLLVDLSAVTFMDASTVGAIVGSRYRLRSRGQSLELRAPSPPALRVLELCGLSHLVEREPLHSTGSAAALATWVDVPPTAPAEAAGDDARITERRPKPRPARVPGAADAHVEDVAVGVDVDRGGP